MKVSVVVPVYNEELYIEKCLQNILNQTEKADEIIVVDNNSIDDTVSLVEKFKDVTIVVEKKQGMTPARNKGFNTAKGDIIARTDADTLVPTDWVARIKDHFEKEDIVALSGPSKFYGVSKIVDAMEWPSKLYFLSFRTMFGHDCLNGPNMAVRRSAWEKVKDSICMDDKQVHEDIDLALHMAEIGKIKFDFTLIVLSSFRRFRKIAPYFEYPYRYIKTLGKHRKVVFLSDKRKKRLKQLVAKYSLKNSKFAQKLRKFTN